MKWTKVTIISLSLSACGVSNDRVSNKAGAILTDSELTKEAVNVNLSDAYNALVDANLVQSSSSALALHDHAHAGEANSDGTGKAEHDGSKREKTCEVKDTSAIETVDASIDHSFNHDGKHLSINAVHEGSTKIVRTWSKEGSSIACKNAKRADINLDGDVTGLKLSVSFERSLARALEISKGETGSSSTEGSTGASNGSKKDLIKKSMSLSAKGTRDIAWVAYEAKADGTSVHSKTIVSSSERTHKRLDKNGVEQVLSYSVQVGKDEPLKVAVTYEGSVKAHNVISKVIESGSIESSRSGDGKIVSTFEQLTLNFDDHECVPASGKMISKIFAEGASEPSKILELSAADGDYTLTDVTDAANPKVLEDTDFEMCDIGDYKD